MNKINTEKYTESFEQWFRDVEAGDDLNWSSPPYLSQEWYQYLSRRELALGAWNKALEVALPTLEQPSDWIEWKGGECPIDDSGRLDLKLRNGHITRDIPVGCVDDWSHKDLMTDIIAYRIIPERATNQNGEQ